MTDLTRSNQYPTGHIAALENPPLSYVLTASLDPTISDQALRIAAGLGTLVAERVADNATHTAYLSLRSVEAVSGLDTRRSFDDLLVEVDQRVGVVQRIAKGTPGVVMTRKTGARHGVAAKWALAEPLVNASPYSIDRATWRLLNPQDLRWSRQHRAWRLCTALVALNGLTEVSLGTGEVARLLGVPKPNAIRIRAAMLKALGLDDDVRSVHLGRVAYDLEPDLVDPGVGLRDMVHRDRFLADDDEPAKAEPAKPVMPTWQPDPDVDYEALRARITGRAS